MLAAGLLPRGLRGDAPARVLTAAVGPGRVPGVLQRTTPSSQPPAPPRPGHPVADLSQKRIKRRPVLGGLISEIRAGSVAAKVKAGGRVLEPHKLATCVIDSLR